MHVAGLMYPGGYRASLSSIRGVSSTPLPVNLPWKDQSTHVCLLCLQSCPDLFVHGCSIVSALPVSPGEVASLTTVVSTADTSLRVAQVVDSCTGHSLH